MASNVLTTLLPADLGVTHTTIRNRTAQVAAELERRDALSCVSGDSSKATELILGLDTGFVRSTTPAIARHHGVLVGCVEHQEKRRYFTAIQRKTTQATTVIRSLLRPGNLNVIVRFLSVTGTGRWYAFHIDTRGCYLQILNPLQRFLPTVFRSLIPPLAQSAQG